MTKHIGSFTASDAPSPRDGETVNFTMEGTQYTFTAPPIGPITEAIYAVADNPNDVALQLELIHMQFEWFKLGMGQQWDGIQQRLNDPNDPVTRALLTVVTEKIMEAVSGRPPTSPAVSPTPQPPPPNSTDGVRPTVSTGTG